MIKTLKNISKDEQLVSTVNGKETVKPGATFETEKAEELLRNYKYLFVEVETEENVEIKENTEELAEDEIKKPAKKTLKNK